MSNELEVKNKIHLVFVETFGVNEADITGNLTRNDVWNWDSMGHLRFIMELEKTFNIKLSAEEKISIFSLEDIQPIVVSHLAA